MFCRFSDAVLVLSADAEHVLLHGGELGGGEGGVLDCSRQFGPLLFVRLTALHNVVGNGRASVITRRIPGQDAGLAGDLRDVKGRGGSGFVWDQREREMGLDQRPGFNKVQNKSNQV